VPRPNFAPSKLGQLIAGRGRPLLCLAAACFVVGGADAEANWEDPCPGLRIRGPVASMSHWSYRIDRSTGTAIGDAYKTSETTVSSDRRTVTEVSFDADSVEQIKSKMFPTTVSQYDGNGRLISHTLKLDGQQEFTVRRCEYDDAGRISTVTQQSKSAEQDKRRITFSYGEQWRRQEWKSPWATVVTTQHLDARGRPIREIRLHVTFQEKSERTFEYADDGTIICYVESGRKLCTTNRYDSHGDLLESRSDRGFRAVTYEYDSYGNWTRQRVESATVGGVTSFRNVELHRRDITYAVQQ
jgi:YD repeat-containing protein